MSLLVCGPPGGLAMRPALGVVFMVEAGEVLLGPDPALLLKQEGAVMVSVDGHDR